MWPWPGPPPATVAVGVAGLADLAVGEAHSPPIVLACCPDRHLDHPLQFDRPCPSPLPLATDRPCPSPPIALAPHHSSPPRSPEADLLPKARSPSPSSPIALSSVTTPLVRAAPTLNWRHPPPLPPSPLPNHSTHWQRVERSMSRARARPADAAWWRQRAEAAEAAVAEAERRASEAEARVGHLNELVAHLRLALRRERAAAQVIRAEMEDLPHEDDSDVEARLGTVFYENFRLPISSIIDRLEKETELRIKIQGRLARLQAYVEAAGGDLASNAAPLLAGPDRSGRGGPAAVTQGRNRSIEIADTPPASVADSSSDSSESSSSGVLLLPSPPQAAAASYIPRLTPVASPAPRAPAMAPAPALSPLSPSSPLSPTPRSRPPPSPLLSPVLRAASPSPPLPTSPPPPRPARARSAHPYQCPYP